MSDRCERCGLMPATESGVGHAVLCRDISGAPPSIQERLRLVAARIAPLPRRTEMWATPLERYIDDVRDAYMVLRESADHIDRLEEALRSIQDDLDRIWVFSVHEYPEQRAAFERALAKARALLSPQGTER